jgi:hypothetical protein
VGQMGEGKQRGKRVEMGNGIREILLEDESGV